MVLGGSKSRWFRIGPPVLTVDHPDFGIVFDPKTGETCFLNDLSCLVFRAVAPEPRSVEQIAQALVGDDEVGREVSEQLIKALLYLREAELVDSFDRGSEK